MDVDKGDVSTCQRGMGRVLGIMLVGSKDMIATTGAKAPNFQTNPRHYFYNKATTLCSSINLISNDRDVLKALSKV